MRHLKYDGGGRKGGTIIVDEECSSNTGTNTAPASKNGQSGSGITVKRVRAINKGWSEHIYSRARRE